MTKKEQVILDNQSFEKYFNVFSKDRMLTMQVLTPQVMDRMFEFIKKNFTNFEIIIKENKIHFKFYTQIREPSLYFRFNNKKGMMNNRKYIYYYYCVFQFIIEVAEYLTNTINELDI